MRAIAIVVGVVAWAAVASAQPEPPRGRPPCALVVVVDQGSLRGGSLEAVRNAIVDILGTVDAADRVAVIGAGRRSTVLVPLTAVSDRKRIAGGVARLRAAGGARVAGGLDAARVLLRTAAETRKRVVVITARDGLAAGTAAHALLAGGVAVSAYGLDGATAAGLAELADAGGGRAVRLDDATGLPAALVAETTLPGPLDPRAVVFVLDRSGSMQGAKLEAAKEAVRVAVEALSPSDLVSVITFDTEAQVVVPLQQAANRMKISSDVARITAGGGTNLYQGLKSAAEQLAGTDAGPRQVIILSDGESPYDGIAELVADLAAHQTTISAVGVAGADRNLLSVIADGGHGRLYMTDDLAALPKLFLREVQTGP